MRRWLAIIGLLFLQLSCLAQVDRKKLDSLARSIDSNARAMQASQDSFIKNQVVIYDTGLRRDDEFRTGKPEISKAPEKKQKQAYILVAIGILVVVVLGLGFWQKNRKSSHLS
jgi:hypothetical protein